MKSCFSLLILSESSLIYQLKLPIPENYTELVYLQYERSLNTEGSSIYLLLMFVFSVILQLDEAATTFEVTEILEHDRYTKHCLMYFEKIAV